MRPRAAVTVFLSLVLLLLLGLVGSMTGLAASCAARAALAMGAGAAADSFQADYHGLLMERYGLMYWYGGPDPEQALREFFGEELNYVQAPGLGLGTGAGLAVPGLQLADLRWKDLLWDGGRGLEGQMCRAAGIVTTEQALRDLLSWSRLPEMCREAARQLEQISGLGAQAAQLGSRLQEVTEHYEGWKQEHEELDTGAKLLLEELSEWNRQAAAGGMDAGPETAWGRQNIRSELKALLARRLQASRLVVQMKEDVEDCRQEESRWMEQAQALRQLLDGQTMPEDSGSAASQAAESFAGVWQSALGEVWEEVESFGSSSQKTGQAVEQLSMWCQACQDPLEQLLQVLEGSDPEAAEQKLRALLGLPGPNFAELESPQEPALLPPGTQSADVEKMLSFRDFAKTAGEQLLSAFIPAEAFPKGTYAPKDAFPGRSPRLGEGLTASQLPQQLLRDAGVCQYLSLYLEHYTPSGGSPQLEYVLQGGTRDSENLLKTALELMLMRQAANLVSLLGEKSKRLEAEALAAAVPGIGQMAFARKLLALGVLIAWAGAEAFCDVRGLLAGGRVPLLKKNADWQLGIAQVLPVLSGKSRILSSDKENGFNYEFYLKILLLKCERNRRLNRFIHMVGLNMEAAEPGFTAAGLVAGVEIELSPGAGTTPPWLGRNLCLQRTFE